MQQETPSTTSSLDPGAVNLAKAIRQVESKGNFTAKGKSGEHGAYQFMPDTWKAYSAEAGINVPLEQATPEQQNEVAYKKIKQWKDQGLNVGQIASSWNAGPGKPNAYIEGNKGTNEYGAQYDTAKYAKDVATQYQTFKGQTPEAPQGGTAIAHAAGGAPEQPEEQKGFLEKAVDFAFPIIGDIKNVIEGDNTKTPGQILGDTALSALWFVPGLGAAGSVATKVGGGILTKMLGQGGARLAGNVAAGGAVGYGADVATGLSQGESLGEAAKPGLGTVFGAGTAGVLSRLGTRYSVPKIMEKTAQYNEEALGATKKGAKLLARSADYGKNPGTFLAQKGINLRQLVNPKTVKYETVETQGKLWDDVNRLEEVGNDALKNTGVTIPLKQVERQVIESITQNKQLGDKLLIPDAIEFAKRELNKARLQFGDKIPLDVLNRIKQGQWQLSKFDATTPTMTLQMHRLLGNAFKTVVEKEGTKAGVPGIAEFNSYIGNHLDAIKALENMNGNAGKGGRLGDLLEQTAFTTIGGGAGAFMGGGPLGMLLGGLAGHYVGGLSAATTRKIMSGPLKNYILKRAQQEEPEAVQKLLNFIEIQMGDKGRTIAPMIPQKQVAPTGVMSQLMTQTAARQGANQR